MPAGENSGGEKHERSGGLNDATDLDSCEPQGCGLGPRGRGRYKQAMMETAVLLCLLQNELHGYELVERVEQMVGSYICVDPGSTYRLLRELENDGHLVSAWQAVESGPARRVYQVTPSGSELLGQWAQALERRALMMESLAAEARAELLRTESGEQIRPGQVAPGTAKRSHDVTDLSTSSDRVIAVPTDGSGGLEAERSSHFGHCDCFTVATVGGGDALEISTVENGPHEDGGCLSPVRTLASAGVTDIVVGGMGARPLSFFGQLGINVLIDQRSETVGQAIEAALNGHLQPMSLSMTCGGGGNCH